ncbi:hypothetical protein E2C01_020808 [Portunus trituberculatus]|uniref:Uncharacterized protein n=1 Tax=Portunus trituberculatus TaxID=210409 RepID=A0A5B7E4H1_PORTR|nr:hypothetical protein [Portunus trituberculatus]
MTAFKLNSQWAVSSRLGGAGRGRVVEPRATRWRTASDPRQARGQVLQGTDTKPGASRAALGTLTHARTQS